MTETSNYIITAANARYFKNLKQLIYTFIKAKEYKNSSLFIYDIGLEPRQVSEIREFEIDLEKRIIYRFFNFNDYPAFVKPEYNTYSWKPIIIYLATLEYRGNYLWMDSANCILKSLKPVWKEIENTSSYAPISGSGTLKEWTVQATMDYLNVPDHFYSKPNRAGNTFGFSMKSEVIRDLITRWKNLALIRECIRPEGANRTNHRDDQSLLTILLLEQEEKRALELTKEKVNISSGSPTKYISVRNQFPKHLNLPNGFLAHLYFKWARLLDIIINKIKGN